MSGLLDKWRTELTKLREKGQSIFPSHRLESGQGVQSPGRRSVQAFVGRLMPLKSNRVPVPCSEDSISMLVHCFSP
ncbi:hypothetical protein V6N13_102964 [Hibiscus sabdariffa]|uniref:Uncharacterized protein n=1 Tax=Hibiscus sabdariffa TaxID=183260 RepID=A0ABR2D5Q4_9ROSI